MPGSPFLRTLCVLAALALRAQDPGPVQQFEKLPAETPEAYTARIPALPAVQVGTGSANYGDYAPERGILPVSLALEEWALAFGPIGPYAIKVDDAQARALGEDGVELKVLARFEVRFGRVRCAGATLVSPVGSFPACMDESDPGTLLGMDPSESPDEYAARVRELPFLRIGDVRFRPARYDAKAERLPVEVDPAPLSVVVTPKTALYLHVDAQQAKALGDPPQGLPLQGRFNAQEGKLVCASFRALTPDGPRELLSDPPSLPGTHRNAQGCWEARFAAGGSEWPLVQIPPGTFLRQGQSIRITGSYWIGQTPVTQAQYAAVMGAHPAACPQAGPDAPVENVSWDDAQAFIARLNAAQSVLTFRLPTEAEWEYAAKGGSGLGGPTDDIAWHQGNSERTPHPVGQKRPNGYGLADMLGNVKQWCQDRYGEFPAQAQMDPAGPDKGNCRTIRGASWNDASRSISVDYRQSQYPNQKSGTVGFRLAASERIP